jgi:hypothetical protein
MMPQQIPTGPMSQYQQAGVDLDAARRAALAQVAAQNDPQDQQASEALMRMAVLHAGRMGSADTRWRDATQQIPQTTAARIAGLNTSATGQLGQLEQGYGHDARMRDYKTWYDTLVKNLQAAGSGGGGGGGGGSGGGGGGGSAPAQAYLAPQAAPALSLADLFGPSTPPPRPAPPRTSTRTVPPPAPTYSSRAASVAAAARRRATPPRADSRYGPR